MENRVCVLLAPGYEEVEALTPVDFLRRAGAIVDVVSTTSEIIVPSAHQVHIAADTFLEDIKAADYGMVIVPGGVPGVPNLVANKQVLTFLQEMAADEHKWITALCAGPQVLDAAGLLQGKTATSYPTWKDKLETIGAYSEDSVVVDGQIITARGVGAAGYFALMLVEKLYGEEKALEIKSSVVMDLVEAQLKR